VIDLGHPCSPHHRTSAAGRRFRQHGPLGAAGAQITPDLAHPVTLLRRRQNRICSPTETSNACSPFQQGGQGDGVLYLTKNPALLATAYLFEENDQIIRIVPDEFAL
jgi:hypothetical protein